MLITSLAETHMCEVNAELHLNTHGTRRRWVKWLECRAVANTTAVTEFQCKRHVFRE